VQARAQRVCDADTSATRMLQDMEPFLSELPDAAVGFDTSGTSAVHTGNFESSTLRSNLHADWA
jgi:hypothetical protein